MSASTETIFAVSSGRPPAAIAIIRVSGAQASAVAGRLAGGCPRPRRATLRAVRDGAGELLDRALLLWFPGPDTATGEDLLEIHAHGGAAVVRAIEAAIAAVPGCRLAEPGEFARRGLENGRIDLAQAEGLADLLAAETEGQRRQALLASEGLLGRQVRDWLQRLTDCSAMIEAAIDYDGEEDVAIDLGAIASMLAGIGEEICAVLAQPPAERLRDGVRVVLAGPRNAGKSSLFNALIEREAAISSPIAGTTRDILEASIARSGIAYCFFDTAGLVEATDDVIEAIGVERAGTAMERADIILWLGDDAPPANGDVIHVHARADLPSRLVVPDGRVAVSIKEPAGVQSLWSEIHRRALVKTGAGSQPRYNERQREALRAAARSLGSPETDLLIIAEHVRLATNALGKVLGVDIGEAVLDALFGRFCLGK